MEPKKIKNIAFDLGGVVLALSLEGGIKGFERIGLKDARQRLDAFVQKGVFADIKRPIDGGKGLDGVVRKADGYFNPFIEEMRKEEKA